MDVTVIKSKRRTVAIQINSDLTVTLRVPRRATKRDIDRILQEKEPWIQKHIEVLGKRMAEYEVMTKKTLSSEDICDLTNSARELIPKRVEYFAKLVGVEYGRITIRHQRTIWGSCSSKGNLNFNCLLMLAPTEVIDYVVVHELCHRKEMNHSKAFWCEVAKVLPEYKKQVKWLKEQGSVIMCKLK